MIMGGGMREKGWVGGWDFRVVVVCLYFIFLFQPPTLHKYVFHTAVSHGPLRHELGIPFIPYILFYPLHWCLLMEISD